MCWKCKDLGHGRRGTNGFKSKYMSIIHSHLYGTSYSLLFGILLSFEVSAREARFEITEEFARDAFRGLENFKDEVRWGDCGGIERKT